MIQYVTCVSRDFSIFGVEPVVKDPHSGFHRARIWALAQPRHRYSHTSQAKPKRVKCPFAVPWPGRSPASIPWQPTRATMATQACLMPLPGMIPHVCRRPILSSPPPFSPAGPNTTVDGSISYVICSQPKRGSTLVRWSSQDTSAQGVCAAASAK